MRVIFNVEFISPFERKAEDLSFEVADFIDGAVKARVSNMAQDWFNQQLECSYKANKIEEPLDSYKKKCFLIKDKRAKI